MKEETKELISWLKEHLSHYRIELATGRVKIGMVAGGKEEERAFAAIDFLNTLPEIESHLCRGGYIQDKNGTPCCNGDNVRFVVADATDNEWCLGRLIWEPKLSAFQIISNAFTCFVSNIKWFEEVYEK